MNDRSSRLPADIHTAQDYAAYAVKQLRPEIWKYLQSNAGKSSNQDANSAAFDEIKLLPRPLGKVAGGNTECKLFGQTFKHPLILAPIAYQRLFHTDGETGTALAAAAQGGQMAVSSLASQNLENIIEAAQQPLWFQLYWQADRASTLRLVKRALSAGYNAVVFTVDAPVKQAVINLPPEIQAVNLEAPISLNRKPSGESLVFDGWMRQAPTWEDLCWLRNQIKVPLIVKGIMHPEDAERCISLGCEGIVVSTHGGRVLDGAPPSLHVLPEIARVVANKAHVLFDSGIRSGQDAFKAISLGADAVLIGRPFIWGLATAGAMGVAHVIKLMRDELELTMALCGCHNLQKIKERKFTL